MKEGLTDRQNDEEVVPMRQPAYAENTECLLLQFTKNRDKMFIFPRKTRT